MAKKIETSSTGKGIGNAGNKPISSKPTVDGSAPTVPNGLVASSLTDGSFTLSWNASTDDIGVTAYDVLKDGILYKTVSGTSTSIVNLTGNTLYSMRVRAKDLAGNTSAYSTPLEVTTNVTIVPDTTPPTAPSNLTASNITSSSLTLNWTASFDAIGVTAYDIYKNGVLLESIFPATTYDVEGLDMSTNYTFSVKAKDLANNQSAFSNTISVSTLGTGGEDMLSFSFTIPESSTVSAGLYLEDDTLVRTIFSNKELSAGSHLETWEPLDDELNPITDVSGMHVKVLSNALDISWEGIIGNNSAEQTGPTLHRSYSSPFDVCRVGDTVFYAVGYNERGISYVRCAPNDIKRLVDHPYNYSSVYLIATDNTNMYWGAEDAYARNTTANTEKFYVFATKISDNTEVIFPYGVETTTTTIGSTVKSTLALRNAVGAKINGIAAQTTGNFLFVARAYDSTIEVYNKTSGQLVISNTIPNTGQIKTDNSHLYVINGTNVNKYSINNTTGVLTSSGSITLTAPASLAVNGTTLLVADSDTSSQIKAFDKTTFVSLWNFGQVGGHWTGDATIADDKFCWKIVRFNFEVGVCFDADGGFYVVDKGNSRILHYNSSRVLTEKLQYRPTSYNAAICGNDSARHFSDYHEYEVDYTKPIEPDNDSWVLVKNWGSQITEDISDKYGRLKGVATLSNGRTYAICRVITDYVSIQIVELGLDNHLRYCQRITYPKSVSNSLIGLYPDGSLRFAPSTGNGVPQVWRKQPLTGFTTEGNPIWGTSEIIASSPSRVYQDPGPTGIRAVAETTGDLLIAYDGSTPNINDKKYHLGAIKIGDDGKWLWRTMPQTFLEYTGPYPKDGAIDIGNGVVRGADVQHFVLEDLIVTGYHGEFWKNSQTNKWNIHHTSGLMLAQFGPDLNKAGEESGEGEAGNAFTGGFTKVGDSYYLTHNDEFTHSGIHLWKINNADSILLQEVEVIIDDVIPNSSLNNLMSGIPDINALNHVNGVSGWNRFPLLNYNNSGSDYWIVRTKMKTHNPYEGFDIQAAFKTPVGYPQAYLSRDLGNINTDFWNIKGKVNLESYIPASDNPAKFDFTTAMGGIFLDILDLNGRVIFRFSTNRVYSTNITTCFINKVPLVTEHLSELSIRFEDIEFYCSGELLMVKYKNSSLTTVPIFDPLADHTKPKTLKLTFFTRTRNDNRFIAIKDFVVDTNTAT